jgi:predicted SAM-dependent methyltransferase
VATPGRPIKRAFSPILELDVDLPIAADALAALGVRGIQGGCGGDLRRFWLNTDARPLHDGAGFTTAPGRLYRVEEDRFFLQHEAPEPLPIEDASLDWCYSEHFIEHLAPEDAIAWLTEVRRVLRAGGLVRISTPDLRRYAEGYFAPTGPFMSEHGQRIARWFDDPAAVERPAFMVNQTFFSWGHRWMYDFQELRHTAAAAGFDPEAVELCRYRQGREADVARLDQPDRVNESLYVEIRR